MKRVLSISLLFILSMTLSAIAGEKETIYGDGIQAAEAVAIDTLLANPDDYIGKNVRVDGVITGVCKKRGCWMQLTNPETGNGVRIKVEDGVIVFPYTSMGQEASAEGVFEAIKLTPEQIEQRKTHAAEEKPEEDCEKVGPKGDGSGATCEIPAKDEYVYLIRGTGAIIQG